MFTSDWGCLVTEPTAYPLAWPQGWPRTKSRQPSRFKVTLHQAIEGVRAELRRLGVNTGTMVISSNVTLTATRPSDAGVAVYFTRQDRTLCIPCDKWDKIEDNLRAVEKTIEALRGIERWGAKHMVDAAFSGFAALPPPPPGAAQIESQWWLVLKVDRNAIWSDIEAAYRDLARKNHPDAGGSDVEMAKVNAAFASAKKERGAR